MPENINEPSPDVPSPTTSNEEIVDPSNTLGNHEKIIIRRHPFGILALYFQAAIAIVAAFGLLFFILPQILSEEAMQQANGLIWTAAFVVTAFVGLFLLIATYIYQQNKWVVTDDSLMQHLQLGLFRSQESELSMANIEDVTSEQIGFLATILGFGQLKVETAGEHSNFYFKYCPTPQKYAQVILHARERYIEESPEQAKRANDLLNVPRG